MTGRPLADEQPALPGLEDNAPSSLPSALETAVRRTIRQLAAEDLLTESLAGHLALALQMARIIDVKTRSGRLSTVSNDARLLTELLDNLTGRDQDGDGGQGMAQLAAAMRDWAESGHVSAAG